MYEYVNEFTLSNLLFIFDFLLFFFSNVNNTRLCAVSIIDDLTMNYRHIHVCVCCFLLLTVFGTSFSRGMDLLFDWKIQQVNSLPVHVQSHILRYRHMPVIRAYVEYSLHVVIVRPYCAVAANYLQ